MWREDIDGDDGFTDAVTWIVEIEGERHDDAGWIEMLETADWAEAWDEAHRLNSEDGRAVRVRHYVCNGFELDLFLEEVVGG